MRRMIGIVLMIITYSALGQQLPPLQPTFDRMMGVNVSYRDPIGRLTVGEMVREFHVWSWNQPQSDQEEWNPQQHIDFQQYYANLTALGHTVVPVLQQTPSWLMRPGTNEQSRPLDQAPSEKRPAGFLRQAAFISRFAQTFRPSGIRYVENWNEPDKDWFGPDACFSPYDMAAMCDADEEALQTAKMKDASPTNLVMGGLAYPSLEYLQGMMKWSKLYRPGGNLPFEVINLHHYSNKAPFHSPPIVGICPEQDHLREKMSEWVKFRNEQLPGQEIWVSEFGYDTQPGSTQGVGVIPGQSEEETQGEWIVRSFLALAAAGVDRAILFAASDAGDPKIRYNTSGLLGYRDGVWFPKRSWYYVVTLCNVLRGTRFDQEIDSANTAVRIYRFTDPEKKREVYAIWSPTAKGKRVTYTFTGNGSSSVKVIKLKDGSTSGERTTHEMVNNQLTLEVSELPLFVLSGEPPPNLPVINRLILTPEMLTGPAEARRMVDEQQQGDPFLGEFVENRAAKGWTNYSAQPVEAVIDLKGIRQVKGILLKDTYDEGFVSVFTLDPAGKWQRQIHDPMRRFFVWDSYFFPAPLATGKIKVVLDAKTASHTSCLGEIMVYVEEQATP